MCVGPSCGGGEEGVNGGSLAWVVEGDNATGDLPEEKKQEQQMFKDLRRIGELKRCNAKNQ